MPSLPKEKKERPPSRAYQDTRLLKSNRLFLYQRGRREKGKIPALREERKGIRPPL